MYEKANSIIKKAIMENRETLNQEETKIFASDFGIPCPPSYIAKSENDAIRLAEKLGYPIILKVLSHKIMHKSDIGGVEKNLQNAQEVIRGYNKVINSVQKIDPKAQILVEKMMPSGIETIIGLIMEPGFGPVVMVGLGGILTELFEDIIFRLAPINLEDAQKAINCLRGNKLFYGYRGESPIDLSSFNELLVKVSKVPQWFSGINQIDLNPVILYETGLSAVDIKVVLKNKKKINLSIESYN